MDPLTGLLVLAASFALQYVLAPKPPSQSPTAFKDIDFPLCEEGEEQSAVFGQVWTKSWMVLTVGNYRTKAIKSDGGKKG